MKKYSIISACVLLCMLMTVFAGCALLPTGETTHPSVQGVPDRWTTENEKIARFDEGFGGFHVSNGYANADPFNCFWSSDCAKLINGRLKMSVEKGTNYGWGREYQYVGAECRTWANYSYGFYSVKMKAAKCSGVISSFFTYTNNGGWDEIDIEFLGKDTTGIQLNYYTKGVGGHEFWYDLGFDGADDFHEYAFEWLPDSITWYVDGKAVYRATDNIPTLPTQIMMNVWNCKGADEWSGKFDPTALPATAEYQWVGYSATKNVA